MTTSEAKHILDVSDNSQSLSDLKRTFKKLMLKWHPDIAISKGVSVEEATIKSQQIILAYEILSQNLGSLDSDKFGHSYRSYYEYKTSKKNYKQYYDHSTDEIDLHFINRITVKSSSVKWIDYIGDLQILIVRFKGSSGYYIYYDIPLNIFERFRIADSPGRFVHQYLGRYNYQSFRQYADWLNVYKSLNDITDID